MCPYVAVTGLLRTPIASLGTTLHHCACIPPATVVDLFSKSRKWKRNYVLQF